MGDAHKRYHPFNFWKKDFPIFYHFYQGFVLDKFLFSIYSKIDVYPKQACENISCMETTKWQIIKQWATASNLSIAQWYHEVNLLKHA